MNAIDTNVLIYAIDQSDPQKQQLAEDFLDQLDQSQSPFVLLWQVAVEFMANLDRLKNRGMISHADLDLYLNRFVFRMTIVLPTVSLLNDSIQLRSQYSLSHYDSLLLAACNEAGVTTLYSEDLSHDTTYGAVTVLNPFLS